MDAEQQEPPPRRAVVVIIPNTPRGTLYASVFHNRRNAWELPGGKVEEGESTYAAARREAEEELGVPVEVNVCSLGEFLHVFRGRLWRCEAFLGDIHGAHVTGSAALAARAATILDALAPK